jgi:long-chain acyl-CoA synthetase
LKESEYAAYPHSTRPSRSPKDCTANAFEGPCSRSPTNAAASPASTDRGLPSVCETRRVKVRIPVTNVAELVRRRASQHGDHPALVDGDTRLTWAELDRQVDAVARGLAGAGLVAGHRVAFALPNRIELVVTYLATLRAGCVAVPLNPTSATGEVASMLADSGARLCLADTSTVATVRAALGDARPGTAASPAAGARGAIRGSTVIVVGSSAASGEMTYADLHVDGSPVMSPLDREALAVLLYTSGTSGRPRAAMLSHRALLANIDQASQTRPAPVNRRDIVLGVLPLFHVYGLNAVLGQVLLQGASLVLGTRFDSDETLRLVAAERVTVVPVAPPVIAAWVGRDDVVERLASVRTLLSGAGPLAEDLVHEFESRTGIAVEQGYGLTEAAPIVTSTIGTPVHKPGSAGRAVPGVELRVVDAAGAPTGVDDAGEILVRGDNVFSGYWPEGAEAPSSDGWLATGDIGFLDSDGDLFMVDRVKEMVIVSGFNVYPSEIEDVVREVAGVRECAVIGVADPRTGEAVLVYVAPTPEADREALPAAVRQHCAQRLARFKQPAGVELVDTLPHSASGKVAKGRLREEQQRRAMGLA